MGSQTFSVILSIIVVFVTVDFSNVFFRFLFFEKFVFERILAGVFAACILHETFDSRRFLSVAKFLPKASFWPSFFLTELLD